jgi:hypothetical protein
MAVRIAPSEGFPSRLRNFRKYTAASFVDNQVRLSKSGSLELKFSDLDSGVFLLSIRYVLPHIFSRFFGDFSSDFGRVKCSVSPMKLLHFGRMILRHLIQAKCRGIRP